MTVVFDNTPAWMVLREVAQIIDADAKTVDQICENMKKELILQEWQLSALEASEWKALGAPIGLAAAIRKLASVDEHSSIAKKQAKSTTPPNVLSSRSTYAKRLTVATKGVGSSSENQEAHSTDLLEPSTGNASKIEEEEGVAPLKKTSPQSLFDMLYETRHDALKAFYSTTFPMSETFDRALLHGKSRADLKAHTVFRMEIGVVVAALLCGASIEMWGIFPQDAVAFDRGGIPDGGEPYVPFGLALTFHCISGAVILSELVCVFMYVGQLLVATAVAETKFAMFVQQTGSASAWTNGIYQLGASAFILNIGVLVMALTLATTSDRSTILVCGIIIPALIILPCEVFFHMFLTFVGRTAFNGYLMVPHENPNSDDLVGEEENSAVNAEKLLCQRYFRDLNGNDEEVLDRCQKLRQVRAHAHSTKGGTGSKTIRNSKLIVPTSRKHNIGTEYFPKYREPQNL